MCTWWTAYQLFPLLMDDQVSYFPRRRHVPWVWGVHTHLEELMNTWIKWLCWMNCRLIKVICLLIFMQSPGPQNRRTRRTCAGDQASLGDQRAGGPENLLALRAEGTRASSWPSNGGGNKTEFVMENLVCQIDSVTKYPLLSFVAYVKIYALFGGDQTDQKSVCGGPNSIVRTGYEALTPNVLPMT